VKYVKGFFRIRAVTREETVEIPNIAGARGAVWQANGRTFKVSCGSVAPLEHRLWLSAVDAVPPTGAFIRIWPTVVDAKGNALLGPGGVIAPKLTEASLDLTCRQLPGVGPPDKLILKFPAQVDELKIPFELGDRPDAAEAEK